MSNPTVHNPDNLASPGDPPWRFLVEGEKPTKEDEWWSLSDQWISMNEVRKCDPLSNMTYRTQRPLPAAQPPSEPPAPEAYNHERAVREMLAQQGLAIFRENKGADDLLILTLSDNVSLDVYRDTGITVVVVKSGPQKGIYEFDRAEGEEFLTLLQKAFTPPAPDPHPREEAMAACPFCGGTDVAEIPFQHVDERGEICTICTVLKCKTCNAQGPNTAHRPNLTNLWNRRTPPPAVADGEPARVVVACPEHKETARQLDDTCPICLLRDLNRLSALRTGGPGK